jgi:hypothetical protein
MNVKSLSSAIASIPTLAVPSDKTANSYAHNPWGEYGHPDHAQVSRVTTTLGAQLGFRTHFSNYVARRSMRVASRFLPGLTKDVVLEPDRALADRVKAVYVEHGCWTWHAGYAPPETEAFLANTGASPDGGRTPCR